MPEDRVRFRCDRCGINLETQAAKNNHEYVLRVGWRRGRGWEAAVWELWGVGI